MSKAFPYTYYSCPCTDVATSPPVGLPGHPAGDERGAQKKEDENEEEQTFNPHHPRANYTLYPLEHLLFCNECHQMRCPRCYYYEVLNYYCPSCLLDTPSVTVKGETNRCTRSCFQCPICYTPLSLSTFHSPDTTSSSPTAETQTKNQPASSTPIGPFILTCPYCSWSTLEIGIKFDKHINLSAQLAKLYNITNPATRETATNLPQCERSSSRLAYELDPTKDLLTTDAPRPATADQFTNLASFYKNELTETAPAGGVVGLGLETGFFDSPGSISRVLSLQGVSGLRKQRGKPMPMREAADESEGLVVTSHEQHVADDEEVIARMAQLGWDGVNKGEQQTWQDLLSPLPTDVENRHRTAAKHDRHIPSSLRPIPTPLRTRRAKRCRECRQYVVRPDEKKNSNKYKIRLVAVNHVPRLSLKPFPQTQASPQSQTTPPLQQGKPTHYLLHVRNPLFDPVRITLATPPLTPGPTASKVTIMCPEFDVGASADVWDEALDSGTGSGSASRKSVIPAEGAQPEAGKIWARGRNWTSVVAEVVPGVVGGAAKPAKPNRLATGRGGMGSETGWPVADDDADDASHGENQDLLEIPILLRVRYETDDSTSSSSGGGFADLNAEENGGNGGRNGGGGGTGTGIGAAAKKEGKVGREMEFWCVLGCGRIAMR